MMLPDLLRVFMTATAGGFVPSRIPFYVYASIPLLLVWGYFACANWLILLSRIFRPPKQHISLVPVLPMMTGVPAVLMPPIEPLGLRLFFLVCIILGCGLPLELLWNLCLPDGYEERKRAQAHGQSSN